MVYYQEPRFSHTGRFSSWQTASKAAWLCRKRCICISRSGIQVKSCDRSPYHLQSVRHQDMAAPPSIEVYHAMDFLYRIEAATFNVRSLCIRHGGLPLWSCCYCRMCNVDVHDLLDTALWLMMLLVYILIACCMLTLFVDTQPCSNFNIATIMNARGSSTW